MSGTDYARRPAQGSAPCVSRLYPNPWQLVNAYSIELPTTQLATSRTAPDRRSDRNETRNVVGVCLKDANDLERQRRHQAHAVLAGDEHNVVRLAYGRAEALILVARDRNRRLEADALPHRQAHTNRTVSRCAHSPHLCFQRTTGSQTCTRSLALHESHKSEVNEMREMPTV